MRSLLKIAKTGYLLLSALLILAGVGLAFFLRHLLPHSCCAARHPVSGVRRSQARGLLLQRPYQLVFESDLVFGILYLALGLLLLLRPAHTMAFLGIVFGLMLLADG